MLDMLDDVAAYLVVAPLAVSLLVTVAVILWAARGHLATDSLPAGLTSAAENEPGDGTNP